MHNKQVFTTGELSDLLHIHQTTVIDWVDKGLLTSYKTPGGHRRITRDALFKFLSDHNMPVPHVLIGNPPKNEENEKHRHLHEGFQVGIIKSTPANPPAKAMLAQRKK